ncbi:hypothetical protein AAG906_038313 [Vitis piasezkii]
MEEAKTMKTPMSLSIKLDKDEKGKSINSTMFSSISVRLGLLVGFHSLLFGFVLSSNFISSFSAFLMVLRRETVASRAQGKRPTEPSQPDQMEARRKARYDTTLFNFVEEYQRYKQKFSERKVVLGRSINFSQLQYFGFEKLFTNLPDSGACILFTGDLWSWRTDHVHC